MQAVESDFPIVAIKENHVPSNSGLCTAVADRAGCSSTHRTADVWLQTGLQELELSFHHLTCGNWQSEPENALAKAMTSSWSVEKRRVVSDCGFRF